MVHVFQSFPVCVLRIPDSTAEEHSVKGRLHLPIKLYLSEYFQVLSCRPNLPEGPKYSKGPQVVRLVACQVAVAWLIV